MRDDVRVSDRLAHDELPVLHREEELRKSPVGFAWVSPFPVVLEIHRLKVLDFNPLAVQDEKQPLTAEVSAFSEWELGIVERDHVS